MYAIQYSDTLRHIHVETTVSTSTTPLAGGPTVTSSTVYVPAHRNYRILGEEELPRPRTWQHWCQGRFALGVAVEAAIEALRKLDPKRRSPCDPLWKGKGLPYGKIRRLVQALLSYATSGDYERAHTACDVWGRIGQKHRNTRHGKAVEALVGVVEALTATWNDEGVNEWAEHQLQRAIDFLRVPAHEMDKYEAKWRLEDFTDGRGREVTDPDVALACLAALEANGDWAFAAIMARRWLQEHVDG